MENSKTFYESSTKQLVTILETFASQLTVSSSASKDSQESDSFDSLLSRPSYDSDSFRADGDSFRPSLSICNNIPSRSSIDSFFSVPSRSSADSFKTIPSRTSGGSYNSTINSRPGYGDSDSTVQSRVGRSTGDSYSYSTLPGKWSNNLPGMSDSCSRLPDSYSKLSDSCNRLSDSNSRVPDSYSRLPDSYRKLPENHYKLAGRSDAYRRHLGRSDSLNLGQSGKSDERMFSNKAEGGPARSRIMMGSNSVRRTLATDTGSGTLARRTFSSSCLLEDPTDCHLTEAATPQDHRWGEKRTLQFRSKSFASGLSSCGQVAGKDKKKDESKVQRFFKQIRSLVAKDNYKYDQKKNNQVAIEDELDEAENTSECPRSRTVIRIRDSLSRSTSQAVDQTKVTPKKLKSFHHSTPRLLK